MSVDGSDMTRSGKAWARGEDLPAGDGVKGRHAASLRASERARGVLATVRVVGMYPQGREEPRGHS